MSTLGIHILTDKQFHALQELGHSVQPFVLSEAQKAVALLKQTDIGLTVMSDIQAVASKQLTGVQKFEQVVANTAPLVLKYVTGGGVSAVLADVSDIARELVQSLYNDFTSTKASSIAMDLLAVLKKV